MEWWTRPRVFYHFAGDDERAVIQLEKTLDLLPTFAGAHQTLGMIHCEHGRFEEGISALSRGGSPDQVAALAYCRGLSGGSKVARKLLRELEDRSQTEFVSPLSFALIHVTLGENDEALTRLERAYEMHLPTLPVAAVYPPFAPLRSDPRFRDLLRRMGFPES